MARSNGQGLQFFANGVEKPVEPDDARKRALYESLIRDEYARCHEGDTLDDLKHRALASKEAQGLLRDWMALAATMADRQGG